MDKILKRTGIRKGYYFMGLIVLGSLLGSTSIIFFTQKVLDATAALIWSIAYVVVGGLGGLLFGIPKTLTKPVHQTNPIRIESQNVKGLMQNDFAARQLDLEQNTNLYQVSDWLTKVIVGAGLVQMREIPGFILRVAEKMSRGLVQKPYTLEAATSLSAAIIIYCTIFGFISGFLITRVMISDMLEGSESR